MSRLLTMATYAASVGVSALVTLLAIPLVIRSAGPSVWSDLAVGQAIGTAFGLAVAFGWGATGPTQVAMAEAGARSRLYLDSMRARLWLIGPGLVISMTLSYVVTHSDRLASALSAASFTLGGLLAGWFFTGVARPRSFFFLDTLPRVGGTAAGVVAVVLHANLLLYPILQCIGMLVGIVLSYERVNRMRPHAAPSGLSVLQLLRGQTSGLLIAGTSALYLSAPITVVSILAPAAVPQFALADKILRFGTTAYSPILLVLQGWVPGGDKESLHHRVRTSFGVGCAISLSGATFLALLLPIFGHLLSGGKIQVGFHLSIPVSIVFACIALAQTTGLVGLMALGKSGSIALFTTVGLCVSLPAVFLGASLFGAAGAAAGLALSELIALIPQVVLLRTTLRYSQRSNDGIAAT